MKKQVQNRSTSLPQTLFEHILNLNLVKWKLPFQRGLAIQGELGIVPSHSVNYFLTCPYPVPASFLPFADSWADFEPQAWCMHHQPLCLKPALLLTGKDWWHSCISEGAHSRGGVTFPGCLWQQKKRLKYEGKKNQTPPGQLKSFVHTLWSRHWLWLKLGCEWLPFSFLLITSL